MQQSSWKRRSKFIVGALLMISAAWGFGIYIGYFGGPVFTENPATGHRAQGHERLAAMVLSGDMGFRIGMAPEIAAKLAHDGIPMIGVNSLTYFRHEGTPDEVKSLISEVTRRALIFGHADKVILIGQSFGADVLHVGLTGMTPALRAKVALPGRHLLRSDTEAVHRVLSEAISASAGSSGNITKN